MKEGNLLQLFPAKYRIYWEKSADRQEEIQEIRLRANRPVLVTWRGQEYYVDEQGEYTKQETLAYRISAGDIGEIFSHICHYSAYAFQDEISQGFLTVTGGHRVGIAGQMVLGSDETPRTIKHISYLNIRVAHQMKGVADTVLPYLYRNGQFENTVIVSPPGCGKTTLLRDLVRQISDGNAYGRGVSVGVVDERSEIAGTYLGQPQNDVGMRTDVMDCCPKRLGMRFLLRSMSPRVIAVDELGGPDDFACLREISACGCKILATIHGDSMEDIPQGASFFQHFIVMGKENGIPVIRRIYGKNELAAAPDGGCHDHHRMPWDGNQIPEFDVRTSGSTAGFTSPAGAICQ